MVASQQMSIDEWVDFEPSASGGGGDYLKWRSGDGVLKMPDSNAVYVDVWLHPKVDPGWRYYHSIPKIWEKKTKDKATGAESTVAVAGRFRFNSMETAGNIQSLKKQGFRDNGYARDHKPMVCPFSKLLEWVFQAILDGSISWTDEIFRFEPDRDKDVIINAGGFVGMLNDRNLSNEDYKELKKAKIDASTGYMQAGGVQIEFDAVVVRDDVPAAFVATEKETLGQAVQTVIKHRRIAKGKELANPLTHPYCFRWMYDESEKIWSNKYTAIAMDNIELRDEVKAVFDEEPPSIKEYFAQSNVAVLEQIFTKHWCHKVAPPWADLFAAAYDHPLVKGTNNSRLPENAERGGFKDNDADDQDDTKTESVSAEDVPSGEVASSEEQIPCDACGEQMPADALTCPHCKVEYANIGGWVVFAQAECEVCKNPYDSKSLKCGSCQTEYMVDSEKGIIVKPKPVETKVAQPKRRGAAKT